MAKLFKYVSHISWVLTVIFKKKHEYDLRLSRNHSNWGPNSLKFTTWQKTQSYQNTSLEDFQDL